ncbi:MAG TPA: DUF2179 domain-containing protein [Bacteroidota bacterium]|nr:DUF2179 domain-containing protein [Bacteroidota bacterium]
MDAASNLYFVYPFLIFLARVVDVSLETVRIILIARGMKILASILGFFEILVWLIVLGEIMSSLNDPVNYIAYAGGFAVGNYVGIWIENKLAMGLSIIRIITQSDMMGIVIAIQSMGYGVTYVEAHGENGPGVIIFAVVRRKDLPQVTDVVKSIDPTSFYTIEDVRFASEATFPTQRLRMRRQHTRG